MITKTWINISEDIIKINDITKNNNCFPLNSNKDDEEIDIYDNEKNIVFKIVCFRDENIKNNKFREILNLDNHDKEYIISEIILRKLKNKYIKTLKNLEDVIISIGIVMKEDNKLRIIVRDDLN